MELAVENDTLRMQKIFEKELLNKILVTNLS